MMKSYHHLAGDGGETLAVKVKWYHRKDELARETLKGNKMLLRLTWMSKHLEDRENTWQQALRIMSIKETYFDVHCLYNERQSFLEHSLNFVQHYQSYDVVVHENIPRGLFTSPLPFPFFTNIFHQHQQVIMMITFLKDNSRMQQNSREIKSKTLKANMLFTW